jgi:cytochrome c-type biogenesis protein CcsB
MHIREGATVNKMLSSDALLQVKATKGSKEFSSEEIVYMSELGGREFEESLNIDGKELTVEYKGYMKNAVKTAVEDPEGNPVAVFVIPTPQGPEKYVLKSGEFIDVGPLAVFFDKEPIMNNKPILRLITEGDKISFVSNTDINWMKMIDRSNGVYKRGHKYLFDNRRMYNINGVQLVTKEVLTKGKVKVVKQEEYKKSMKMQMKMQSLDALIVDVGYNGEHREVALMGKGKRYQGFKERIKIDDLDITLEWGSKIIELPFSLRLRDFLLLKYPGSMSPSSYESHVTLIDKENLIQREHRIYMNNTLDYGGYLFFQSSYDQDEKGTILSVNHDPGKWPTYLGYTLLAIGMFLNLFNPYSYFGKLARKKYEYKASLVATFALAASLFYTQPLVASPVDNIPKIDIDHANYYATMLVQSPDGRIKPLDSYAIDLINKVAGRDSIFGFNHNQIILGMAVNQKVWKQIDMIKVTHPKVKEILGISKDQKTFAYVDAFDKFGQYKLGPLAEEALRTRAAERGKYEKDLIKVDERLNVAYAIYSGRFMNVFPLEGDPNNKWYYPEYALKNFPPQLSHEILAVLESNSKGLKTAFSTGNWDSANKAIDSIKEFQNKYGASVIPDSTLVEAELLYNKLKIFDRLFPVYLIAGFILLILIFVRLAKPNLNIKTVMRLIFVILVVAFVAHTISLGLRWFISGHAPWSNGYEAMLYISWTIVLAGISFARSSDLAMATTSIFAGVTLFVAHLSWLDPQITTMVPVLKSYWLTIHVSIITASYGFLGLSTLLGFVSLIFYIMLNNESKREQLSVNILESTRISQMSMILGLSLLTVGNFLGGVWANESWGRYWGWDPKETWALVSILVYVFVTHMRFVPALKSNFTFNAVSVVAYSAIIMTYFGVNYYLSGLHSYAAGDPVPIPEWIYYVISVIVVVIVAAWFNRNKLIDIKPTKQN